MYKIYHKSICPLPSVCGQTWFSTVSYIFLLSVIIITSSLAMSFFSSPCSFFHFLKLSRSLFLIFLCFSYMVVLTYQRLLFCVVSSFRNFSCLMPIASHSVLFFLEIIHLSHTFPVVFLTFIDRTMFWLLQILFLFATILSTFPLQILAMTNT